ncbi:AAA family ATPase [Sphaerisporangium album]|nr:MoxR family ATPase [Sphaerisporangium album]
MTHTPRHSDQGRADPRPPADPRVPADQPYGALPPGGATPAAGGQVDERPYMTGGGRTDDRPYTGAAYGAEPPAAPYGGADHASTGYSGRPYLPEHVGPALPYGAPVQADPGMTIPNQGRTAVADHAAATPYRVGQEDMGSRYGAPGGAQGGQFSPIGQGMQTDQGAHTSQIGQAGSDPIGQAAQAGQGGQDDMAALALQFQQRFQALAANMEQVIRGKRETVELALICLFCEGHVLIEDVPGTGKTTLARSLAASIQAELRRVQFTPDLLPSDITGVSIFDQASHSFEFHRGPVFANLVLADEINRASPKTQAALLEVMEERRVTVDAESHPVPRPFMVLATQNPVDMDGTYPLPEAQLDRFLMRVAVGYPDHASEVEVLKGMPTGPQVERLPLIARAADVAGMIDFAARIHVADSIYDYVVAVVGATRRSPEVRLGASPRASLALLRACRVRAAAAGRHYVVPEDVKALAVPVLAHRLLLTAEAELRGRTAMAIVADTLATTPGPQALAGV